MIMQEFIDMENISIYIEPMQPAIAWIDMHSGAPK